MHALWQHMLTGQLTWSTVAVWTVLSVPLSVAGGALGGMVLAGKDLGNGVAAMMGGMFGPVAATPGILLGLALLCWL